MQKDMKKRQVKSYFPRRQSKSLLIPAAENILYGCNFSFGTKDRVEFVISYRG